MVTDYLLSTHIIATTVVGLPVRHSCFALPALVKLYGNICLHPSCSSDLLTVVPSERSWDNGVTRVLRHGGGDRPVML